ncbi:MAG: DNA ligase D [Phycisphaerales bacterium]|nr:DNA ligase D [Phycisphaerales bacterium]
MGLTKYAQKRDFSKTPEPGAVVKRSKGGDRYLIQKHDATRLHYDFRLELDGVLKSWAVPKGPSLDPADKRLAVEVEDHPLDYGDFEGTIPQGEYGGGTVMLWDTGTWEALDPDPRVALRRGRLHVRLHGKKLNGEWTLSRMARREGEEKNNWLLIKRIDGKERPGHGDEVLETKVKSVKTGRTMEQIAAGKGGANVWRSNRAEKWSSPKATREKAADVKPARTPTPAAPRASKRSPGPKRRSKASPSEDLPTNPPLTPQLCVLADSLPRGDEWIHEIKIDGYRLFAAKAGGEVRLITRAGHDWTAKFQPIADALGKIKAQSFVIDGEAAVTDARGRTSFQLLQQAIKKRAFDTLVFFAFDVLVIDGEDVRTLPLMERKARLAGLLGPAKEGAMVRATEYVEGRGADVQDQACRLGLEGMVSKLKRSLYEGGRVPTWLKVKCGHRQEFVVVGWTDPGRHAKGAARGRGRGYFGSLLLGAHNDKGQLVYTGKVGTGFDDAGLRDMFAKLRPLALTEHPLDLQPPRSEVGGAHWVKPKIVVEVAFTEWTDDGRLRHPSFQGLREDKAASAVRIEKEQPVTALGKTASAMSMNGAAADTQEPPMNGRAGKVKTVSVAESDMKRGPADARLNVVPRAKRGKAAPDDGEAVVAGVRVSNPQRVVYPAIGVSKLDVARYYEGVSEWMLPFVAGRPLSVVRCTGGLASACFFQKHPGDTFGPPVKAVPVRESEGMANYIAVSNAAGLVSLVQMGVLEVHPWGSKAKTLERPDLVVFDLDPAPGLPFQKVKEGALQVRQVLRGMGVKSWLKTSGGKGLHIVVPVKTSADATWDKTKAFAEQVAKGMTAMEPDRYLAKASKSERAGKVFIDWLRNGRGATSVAPYSPRAREKGGVAMPITWEGLDDLESADQYTVANTLDYLKKRRRDPWSDYEPVNLNKLLRTMKPPK